MRSFPSSAEVAREAELEKQELAMKRKRSAHEVRITIKIALPINAHGLYLFFVTKTKFVTRNIHNKQLRNLQG